MFAELCTCQSQFPLSLGHTGDSIFILLPSIYSQGNAMSKEQEDQGFRITDKRPFTEDGERQQNVPAEESSGAQDAPSSTEEPQPAAGGPEEAAGEDAKIDFPSYVLSYYTQGLVLLGEVPNPYTKKKEEDLKAARHTVDILTLLQEKTKGNLTQDENQLLESVLYELRMKYMAKRKVIKL